MTGGDRQILKAAAPKKAADKVRAVAEKYGMKEYVAFGRVLEWFAAQDDLFQRSVLGFLDDLEVDAARAFMERKAAAEEAAIARTGRDIDPDMGPTQPVPAPGPTEASSDERRHPPKPAPARRPRASHL